MQHTVDMQVHPHGSVDCLPFDAMGSGSLNAISMLETRYRDDMSKEEAMDLVAGAIKFGVPPPRQNRTPPSGSLSIDRQRCEGLLAYFLS